VNRVFSSALARFAMRSSFVSNRFSISGMAADFPSLYVPPLAPSSALSGSPAITPAFPLLRASPTSPSPSVRPPFFRLFAPTPVGGGCGSPEVPTFRFCHHATAFDPGEVAFGLAIIRPGRWGLPVINMRSAFPTRRFRSSTPSRFRLAAWSLPPPGITALVPLRRSEFGFGRPGSDLALSDFHRYGSVSSLGSR
jgi:hypothetical protein